MRIALVAALALFEMSGAACAQSAVTAPVINTMPTGPLETVIQSAATYRGGTAATAGTSQQLMAANTARRGWNFQNQASGFCYVKIGAAATADNLSIRVAPGGFLETPSNHTSTAAINVLCNDAGAAFYSTEW